MNADGSGPDASDQRPGAGLRPLVVAGRDEDRVHAAAAGTASARSIFVMNADGSGQTQITSGRRPAPRALGSSTPTGGPRADRGCRPSRPRTDFADLPDERRRLRPDAAHQQREPAHSRPRLVARRRHQIAYLRPERYEPGASTRSTRTAPATRRSRRVLRTGSALTRPTARRSCSRSNRGRGPEPALHYERGRLRADPVSHHRLERGGTRMAGGAAAGAGASARRSTCRWSAGRCGSRRAVRRASSCCRRRRRSRSAPSSTPARAWCGWRARPARARRSPGDFGRGRFQVAQSKTAKGLTDLKLKGGNFGSCKGSAKKGSAAAKKKTIRSLFSKAKGKFRTRGRYSAASVRGTTWLVEDRCDGTLTRVTSGKVSVLDFKRKRTVKVKAGKSYLARAKR